MGEKPRVQALIARWGLCDWETRCVDSEDVPLWLDYGWLNYMRDPFDLEKEMLWRVDENWETYLQQMQQSKQRRKWFEQP